MDLLLSPGEERDDLEFRLGAQHILAGRVIDPEGNGVAQADVIAANVGARYYHRTTTDREGGFLVEELSSASVKLEILTTSYSALRRTVTVDTTCVLVLGANDRVLIGSVVDAVTSRPIDRFEVDTGKGAIRRDPSLKPARGKLHKFLNGLLVGALQPRHEERIDRGVDSLSHVAYSELSQCLSPMPKLAAFSL